MMTDSGHGSSRESTRTRTPTSRRWSPSLASISVQRSSSLPTRVIGRWRRFVTCHGVLVRVGVEGTNSYGAGLSRHLHAEGIAVVEVIRPARQVRRMRGKSDEIDAYAAAHTALAANDTVTAKTGVGSVSEAIRVTNAGRRSALKARTEVIVAAEVADRDCSRAHPRRVSRPHPPGA